MEVDRSTTAYFFDKAEGSGGAFGKFGKSGSIAAQAGALSVQITACGAIRLLSSKALDRTPRICGAPEPAVKMCEPQIEQNPRRVRLPLSAMLSYHETGPEWLISATRKKAFVVPVPPPNF